MTRYVSSIVCLLFFVAVSFQSAQAAAGLLLYTAGGSPYVSAVQYETFSSPSAHLSYVTVKGGQRMQVRSDGIIANIPYPSSGSQVDQGEASGWIAQADMFAGRYPQYSTLLQSIGELWKRKLETTKVEQVPAPVTSTGSSSQPKSTGVQAPKSEIAVLRTKSGQIFKKVTITRFDGDTAIINYAEGIGRVPLSDFGDMSGLPSDVKLAIEKVTAAINEAKNKAEAERIAKEEKERAAKEAEEQRLARLKQEQLERSEQSKKTQEVLAHLAVAEQERIANQKREQERLASSADSSNKSSSSSSGDKHFTGLNQEAKSMVNLWCREDPSMVAWIERQFAGMSISNDEASDLVIGSVNMVIMLSKEPKETPPRLKEELVSCIQEYKSNASNGQSSANKAKEAEQTNLNGVAATKDSTHNNLTQSSSSTHVNQVKYPDFTMRRRGPVFHGFQLGMTRDEFDSNLKTICPNTSVVGHSSAVDISGLVGVSRAFIWPDEFVSPELNSGMGGHCADAIVVSIGSPPVVVAFNLCEPVLVKIFHPPDQGMTFKSLCQSIVNSDVVPKLNGNNKTMTYESNNGWFFVVSSSESGAGFGVALSAIPEGKIGSRK